MERGFSSVHDDVSIIYMRVPRGMTVDYKVDGVQVLHRSTPTVNHGSAQRLPGISGRSALRVAHGDEIIHLEGTPTPGASSANTSRHTRRQPRRFRPYRRPSQSTTVASPVPTTEDDILQRLWTVKYTPLPEKEDDPCPVCLQDYENGEDVATLPCSHKFHSKCVASWLTRSNVCPMCKNAVFPHAH